MNNRKRALEALKTLEDKDFTKDEIGRLVGYLDERERAIAREETRQIVQPILNEMRMEFAAVRSEMVTKKLAWTMFLAVMAALVAVAPEAISKAIAFLK